MMDRKPLPAGAEGPTVEAIAEPPEAVHAQAARLAERLAMAPPSLGRWERVLFPALHALVDRIEALELRQKAKGDGA